MERGYYLDDKAGKRQKQWKARIRIGNDQRIVGANGMKSIYANSAIASMIDKGEMG